MAWATRVADVQRYLRLERHQKLAWLEAFGAVALARAGTSVVSLEKLTTAFGVELCRGEPQPAFCDAPPVVSTAARVRSVLLRWPSRSRCLVGALAAGLLLRKLKPTLFVGVQRSAGVITAHAWLEVTGGRVPLMLPDDRLDFSVLRRSRSV